MLLRKQSEKQLRFLIKIISRVDKRDGWETGTFIAIWSKHEALVFAPEANSYNLTFRRFRYKSGFISKICHMEKLE